eukprot:7873416-Pyramimonas_sp.AAC.1
MAARLQTFKRLARTSRSGAEAGVGLAGGESRDARGIWECKIRKLISCAWDLLCNDKKSLHLCPARAPDESVESEAAGDAVNGDVDTG